MKKQKIISSVEVHNNKEFIVWRKEDDTAIATLTITLKGRYLVNEIRVLTPRNKTMDFIITLFSDLYTAEMDAVSYIKRNFGECEFSESESYKKWKKDFRA